MSSTQKHITIIHNSLLKNLSAPQPMTARAAAGAIVTRQFNGDMALPHVADSSETAAQKSSMQCHHDKHATATTTTTTTTTTATMTTTTMTTIVDARRAAGLLSTCLQRREIRAVLCRMRCPFGHVKYGRNNVS
jgi:hypothetical protein